MPFRSSKFGSRQTLSDYLLSGKSKTQHSQNITRVSATGGTTFIPGNGYKYHIFTAPGTLRVGNGGAIDYILVAGGGGGGGPSGGGGGAGGYLSANQSIISAGTYSVTIGPGGTQNTNGTPTTLSGPPTFTTLTATAGGRGANPVLAGPGGSGGGGYSASPTGGTGTSGQGSAGGNGNPGYGGGGGGAGGAGGTGSPLGPGGTGGIGRPAFQGDTGIPPAYGTPGPQPGRYFAGGGGGNGVPGGGPPGLAGPGGAGGGGGGGPSTGTPGTTNTGGGGGGAGPGFSGGTGGSGIVIIRYLL